MQISFVEHFCPASTSIDMQDKSQKQNDSKEKNGWSVFLGIIISVYLAMVVASFIGSMWLMFNPIDKNLKQAEIDLIQKEIDRSYNRFFSQFNFALFLIGTSVWVLRQSVVSKLKADVRKEFEEDYERFKNEFKEKFENLTEEFDVQKEKSDAIERLSASIPKSTYLKKFEDRDARKALKNLVTLLERLDQSHPNVFTIRDRILLGDGFLFLAFYLRGNSFTNNCSPNKENSLSSEVSSCFKKAMTQYEKAIKDQPQAYSAWLGKGTAQAMLGRYDEAIKSLTTLIDKIESSPRDVLASALISRGLATRGKGQEEEKLRKALIDFDKATKIDPQNSRAWCNKACYHALLDEFDVALNDLKEALKLIPKLKDDAEKDSDFDSIRQEIEFRDLMEA